MQTVREIAAAIQAKRHSPEYLKARREELGITQEEVAKAAGGSCSSIHISYFENGEFQRLSEYGLAEIPKAYAKAEAARRSAPIKGAGRPPKNTELKKPIAELYSAGKGPKEISRILAVGGVHMTPGAIGKVIARIKVRPK